MKIISRREFLKYSIGAAGGMAVVVVGSKLSWLSLNPAYAQAVTQTLHFRVTDAIKEMHTHEPSGLEIGTGIVPNEVINDARCYFWIYKSVDPGGSPALDFPPESPGPVIVAAAGDDITITVTNDLDEPHAFFIPGMVDSGPIAPDATWTDTFTAGSPGGHLYYDNLNEPVNRVMGLHGAFIVMPVAATPGHKFTPYGPLPADHAVQRLYDDFGSSTHFPGLAWEESAGNLGDSGFCPPFRQYVWLSHQASPKLFAEVGSLAPGVLYDPLEFMNAFLRDPFQPHAFHTDNPGGNRIPQYFTFSGQSGYFSHLSPYITPMGRVGEPVVVHILNPGLWLHAMHLHANHFYVTTINGVVQPNPLWLDVFQIHPMDRVDYTVPFTRPPDVPNVRGIGLPDMPLTSLAGLPTWPPMQELDMHLPDIGDEIAENIFGEDIDLAQRLSPLCYPMHDHSEPSQTCQGGNYNTGLISGIYFVGDRNVQVNPGIIPVGYPADFPVNFPEMEDWTLIYRDANGNPVRGINVTSPAAPPTTTD